MMRVTIPLGYVGKFYDSFQYQNGTIVKRFNFSTRKGYQGKNDPEKYMYFTLKVIGKPDHFKWPHLVENAKIAILNGSYNVETYVDQNQQKQRKHVIEAHISDIEFVQTFEKQNVQQPVTQQPTPQPVPQPVPPVQQTVQQPLPQQTYYNPPVQP